MEKEKETKESKGHIKHHHVKHHHTAHKKEKLITKQIAALMVIAVLLVLFNQFQINSISKLLDKGVGFGSSGTSLFSGDKSLDNVDVTQIESTAQAIAALFPLDQIQTTNEAIAVMIPTGTPDYGQEMGVSFDDPVNSMNSMARAYPALKKQVQQNSQIWQRYLSLAAAPRGISCEFCCGVGPQGVDSRGNLRCGCKHNPAAQTIALWLMQNTDYSDAQILKEVMRWKSLWFPRNMVGIASQIAGGDTSVLKDLPGMVGGC